MKKENVRGLSKEELIDIVDSEYKSAPIIMMFAYIAGAQAVVCAGEYFFKAYPNEPFVHFSTFCALTLGLTAALVSLVNTQMINKRKIEALTELLRKSNVIHS